MASGMAARGLGFGLAATRALFSFLRKNKIKMRLCRMVRLRPFIDIYGPNLRVLFPKPIVRVTVIKISSLLGL